MAKHLYREIATDTGPVQVRVNRRGCTGKWTPADDAALAEIVRAAMAMTPEQIAAAALPRSPEDHT
jgi:hypothetical protein